jgi:galacturan 1,4-alpha-galacturonidase
MTIKFVVEIFFFLPLLACIVNAAPVVFDITTLGAQPGGDISGALLNAWKQAVVSTEPVKIVIPPGTWQLSQAKLEGPNKSPIELNVQGTLKAPLGSLPDKEGEWVTINYVDRFELSGGGVFDGQGQQVWKGNDCNKNSKCAKLPLNLSFNFIKNAFIHDVTTKDSKNFHVNCISSSDVTFQRFTVSAPAEAPNTDGIHIALSNAINVLDSTIMTGDDCISIGDGSTNYRITNVTCGPGHGISIGSLGKNPAEKDVKGISVTKCTFKGTQNGIRIKTWPSAPAKITVRFAF